jgi:hypothetical protein
MHLFNLEKQRLQSKINLHPKLFCLEKPWNLKMHNILMGIVDSQIEIGRIFSMVGVITGLKHC